MPPRFWACHGKDCKGKPCGYQVPVGKIHCDACGHMPPIHISCPGKGDGAKGGRKPGNSEAPKAAKGIGKGGTPELKLKAALDAKAAAEAKTKESNKAQAALRDEVQKLKEAAAAAPSSAPEAAMELDHDGTEAGASALEAAISAARDELKQTQAFTDFQKSLVPDYAATLAAAHAKVEAALVARRAASPLKKQLEGEERHQQRSAKKVADAKGLLETRRKQAADAQAAVQLQEKALADLEAVLAKADAQVASLAARFAAERNAAPATPEKSGAALRAVDAAAQPDASPDGFVSRSFAEEKWAEREAHFARQLEQLQSLVADGQAGGALPEAAPSEASDLGTLEQLESLADDDVAWGKVDKTKRKAVLSRQRDRLAKQVKTSIGGFTKISGAHSPFSK
jgi:hypothetical protein